MARQIGKDNQCKYRERSHQMMSVGAMRPTPMRCLAWTMGMMMVLNRPNKRTNTKDATTSTMRL